MSGSLSKIFISYSHQDYNCASGIARFLNRQGYDIWIDSGRIKVGEEWVSDIDYALNNCDVVLAIISENSVRRKEVLREISVALSRLDLRTTVDSNDFRLLFVVIGKVHPSWFSGVEESLMHKIIDFMHNVQFIQLDAKANVTIATMQNLLRALHGQMIYTTPLDIQREADYIFETALPERVYDNVACNFFYRIRPSDLAPSTVFPFALDNQWLPDEIMNPKSEWYASFLRHGFSSHIVREYLDQLQLNNLYIALIHSKQVIVNRAAILNSHSLQRLYFNLNDISESMLGEQQAFRKFLENGSIVVFLYGDNEITPYVKQNPMYSTSGNSIDEWNKLCKEVSMYCIRENWETPIDKHRIEFAKYCTTMAHASSSNEMLAKCFGFDSVETREFFTILKEIEMTVFLQTHIIGTGHRSTVNGYSRSAFYKSFIVSEDTKREDAVLNCIFDTSKPFFLHLKKIIDIYYNSIFANYFNCHALIPNNILPEDTYIHQLYLEHGKKEVGVDELKYAFSEFFESGSVIDMIATIGADYYVSNWSMEKILTYRQSIRWIEYMELTESIVNRSTHWRVDFSEVEQLVKVFVSSISDLNEHFARKSDASDNKQRFSPAYSFRICIGSKVLDIVCEDKIKKLKQYPGTFFPKDQNSLSIQFQIGDTTLDDISKSIFYPIEIFDGKTNYVGGSSYFEDLCNFLISQYEFVWLY